MRDFALKLNNVSCAELAVLRVGLGLKGDLLAFVQRLEAVALNCGEMYEYVLAALIVGDEAVALFCVKPFDCTVVNCGTSI